MSILVAEVATLKQRIVGKADARDDMTSTECHLLSLREELVWVPVELKLAHILNWNEILGPDLSGIKNVEIVRVFLTFWNYLNTKVPLGECSTRNGLPQVFSVEVRVLACQFEGLVPHKAMNTEMRCPVKLDEKSLSLRIVECEGVHPKPLHHAVRSRNGSVRLMPHEHVSCLCMQVLKIPEVVVG